MSVNLVDHWVYMDQPGQSQDNVVFSTFDGKELLFVDNLPHLDEEGN